MKPMLEVRVYYCVPCGYLGLASWIAQQLFEEGGEQVALLLVPGLHGILDVQIDGENVYSKLSEDQFPTPPRIAAVRGRLRERLRTLDQAAETQP
jgi:selT/selW/selH-like putative selenoprotein